MAQQIEVTRKERFHYGQMTIHKDQQLGHGAYGAVYKAKCGHLPCAAKVLHLTIVDPYDPGSGRIMERFQQECDFLSGIRHPNIVQYLGVCSDPESKLPVLLMELMDESLTKMLERSQLSISYHVQVDLCHDISLAVAFLHLNEIFHRDLSGNNVLVIAGRRAKVTDFGMSKFNAGQQITPLTMCPGTLAYMSPEALKEPPQYTDKLDVFSQGVIVIQVCSRQFPNPGPSRREIKDPRSHVGTIEIPVLERERRKEHIDLIDPHNPLLAIAMDCIEYKERDRPTASQLCERLAMLKEQPMYVDSKQYIGLEMERMTREFQQEREKLMKQIQAKEEQIHENEEQICEKDEQIRVKDEQIREKDEQIRKTEEEISEKYEQIREKDEQIDEKAKHIYKEEGQTAFRDRASKSVSNIAEIGRKFKDQVITAQEKEIKRLLLQLQEKEREVSELRQRNQDNQQEIAQQQSQIEGPKQPGQPKCLELKWVDREIAEFQMRRRTTTVVDGDVVYVPTSFEIVFTYTTPSHKIGVLYHLVLTMSGGVV